MGNDSLTALAPKTRPLYRQAIGGCLEAAIGKHGLTPTEMARSLARLAPALALLQDAYRTHRLAHLRIVEEEADLVAVEAALASLSQGASTIVFFGSGGASLGGQTLAQLGGWNIPGMASAAQRERPRTRFYDNLDGVTLAAALASFELASTRFIVISKTGGTPETLVQALAALAAVKAAGLEARIGELFLGITEPSVRGKSNPLRSLFAAHGIPLLDHHPEIGERYAVFTNVGLLPAMARGLNARAIRAGAREVVAALMAAAAPEDFAAAQGAAVVVGLARERGVRAQVLMPYSDRLGRLAHWFAQLWAESLGKDGQGTAPIGCLGPVDQHSQLQLFLDGPRDYLISLVCTPTAGIGPRISPELAALAGLDSLANRAVGDLVAAQALAVPQALSQAGRPVRTFDLPVLDEGSVGALMMHFMLETILAAHLLGVDPFDRPAVELVEIITRRHLAALREP
jgi:glucose-6-phosphate isomerase